MSDGLLALGPGKSFAQNKRRENQSSCKLMPKWYSFTIGLNFLHRITMDTPIFPRIYPVTNHTDHVGPGSTFIALKGMKEDGASYIEKALNAGASALVLEQGASLSPDQEALIKKKGATVSYVPSARRALVELSAAAFGYPARSLRIIAITGTKGKTTTAFLIEHILKTAGYKTALLSTVENRILDNSFKASLTTAQPDYLHAFFDICRDQGVQYVVMEVAAQALTLHRVATLEFDSIVFTNFSLEHSEFYASQEEYFKAKCSIFDQLAPGGHVVLNADDEAVARLPVPHQTSFFGIKHPAQVTCSIEQSDLTALALTIRSQVRNQNDNLSAIASLHTSDPVISLVPLTNKHITAEQIVAESEGDLAIAALPASSQLAHKNHERESWPSTHYTVRSTALLGEFSASNILAAIAVVERYGVKSATISKAIASFEGVSGRLQRFILPNKAVACIDNAHTPSSFEALLTAVRPLSNHIIALFGAGGERDPVKRPLMGAIAARYADTVILTTDNPRSEDPAVIIDEIKKGIETSASHKILIELDREKAIRKAYALSAPGTLILLLGKGPVEYQHIKDAKIPFSEAAILRSF